MQSLSIILILQETLTWIRSSVYKLLLENSLKFCSYNAKYLFYTIRRVILSPAYLSFETLFNQIKNNNEIICFQEERMMICPQCSFSDSSTKNKIQMKNICEVIDQALFKQTNKN